MCLVIPVHWPVLQCGASAIQSCPWLFCATCSANVFTVLHPRLGARRHPATWMASPNLRACQCNEASRCTRGARRAKCCPKVSPHELVTCTPCKLRLAHSLRPLISPKCVPIACVTLPLVCVAPDIAIVRV
ncbi:hypothetical protein PF011_g6513 [Phytophthora fragariae]|uniref:Secreted protein n=1 Tax=Phytophthora fragariae TaxID=53985 RepID=A0A6A3LEQ2_9STRA|nr:hypothetical protein PF011_g6513 [Phytophthora fragariae]